MNKESKKSDPIPHMNTDLFFNRELSSLKFNQRILKIATSEETALLERVKFLSIFCRNLDEFFMVRVAGKKKTIIEDLHSNDSPDSLSDKEVLHQISMKTKALYDSLYSAYNQIKKDLYQANIKICQFKELSQNQQAQLTAYFKESLFPVLTPLAVDSAHPFPFLSNLALYLFVCFKTNNTNTGRSPIAFVEMPSVLPRLVPINSSEDQYSYILLEDLVAEHLDDLFMSAAIHDVFSVRVTRDLDYTLLENEVVDLLKSVQAEVKNQELSQAVRLEVQIDAPRSHVEYLRKKLQLKPADVYQIAGPLALDGLNKIQELPLKQYKEASFNPRIPFQLRGNKDIFAVISDEDLLVHHPYDSFYTVIELLNAAASDSKVLAIKQTLYRTSGDSPIIRALMRAAESGKSVTAVVELKARFDEKNNIIWARELEQSGVNVVFGFIGLKTHAKTTLIIRQEGDQLIKYAHLSTGNYNSSTARLYADIGLFTTNTKITLDLANLFNLLTGFNITSVRNSMIGFKYPVFQSIVIAPLNLRESFLDLIDEEINYHHRSKNGHIIAKMNALVDKAIIEKLYEASKSGVKIQLLVRGICCLKPGIPGISDHIEVISIIDRFLEHSRIYCFNADGKQKVYLSSADWMPRNMDHRIEILFPILNKNAKDRVIHEILSTYWLDNESADVLNSDGNYVPRKEITHNVDSVKAQKRFIELAREQGIKSIPYEKAIRHNLRTNGRPIYKRKIQENILRLKKNKNK